MELILPKTTESGKPKLSYSQYKNFKSLKSFNLSVEGRLEYMVGYFYRHTFKDKGWGQFGQDVEDYITEREKAEFFTGAEKTTLNKIEPLGNFSERFFLDLGDFDLEGIIDDTKKDYKKIRDYKTASKNSKKQYYEDTYNQLDIYAMYILQKYGFIPELEVCIIERKGNVMFKGDRSSLTVGSEVWYVDRQTSLERLEALKLDIIKTAWEISEYYKIFLKLNK